MRQRLGRSAAPVHRHCDGEQQQRGAQPPAGGRHLRWLLEGEGVCERQVRPLLQLRRDRCCHEPSAQRTGAANTSTRCWWLRAWND